MEGKKNVSQLLQFLKRAFVIKCLFLSADAVSRGTPRPSIFAYIWFLKNVNYVAYSTCGKNILGCSKN